MIYIKCFVYLCLLKVVDAILPPLTTLAFSRNGKRDGGAFLRGGDVDIEANVRVREEEEEKGTEKIAN